MTGRPKNRNSDPARYLRARGGRTRSAGPDPFNRPQLDAKTGVETSNLGRCFRSDLNGSPEHHPQAV